MKNSENFDARVNEILTSNGLDFTIEKLPLVAPKVSMHVNELGELTESTKYINSPYYALMNSKSGEILNSVKSGYTVSQNKEIIELILRGIEPFGEQLSVAFGGSLNGGRRIFLQLAIEGKGKVGDDIVKSFLTYVDSNDGSSSCGWGISNVTASCANQFFQFNKNCQSKFRHTASLTQRIQEIPMLIERVLADSYRTIETYQKMVGVKIDAKVKHQLVKHLIGVSKQDSVADLSNVSTRVINSMEELYSMIEIETAQKGNNVWGLHSGTTRWTTHSKSAPRRENGRIEGIMVGTNYRTNQKSFDFALDLL